VGLSRTTSTSFSLQCGGEGGCRADPIRAVDDCGTTPRPHHTFEAGYESRADERFVWEDPVAGPTEVRRTDAVRILLDRPKECWGFCACPWPRHSVSDGSSSLTSAGIKTFRRRPTSRAKSTALSRKPKSPWPRRHGSWQTIVRPGGDEEARRALDTYKADGKLLWHARMSLPFVSFANGEFPEQPHPIVDCEREELRCHEQALLCGELQARERAPASQRGRKIVHHRPTIDTEQNIRTRCRRTRKRCRQASPGTGTVSDQLAR
jgi:hypothetical protein